MDQEENSPWQYKPGDSISPGQEGPGLPEDTPATVESSKNKPDGTVSWAASEYIEHHHGASWYGLLIMSTALLAAGVYIITKDIIATVTIAIVGVIVGVFAGHKPGQAQYEISDSGLSVNGKHYNYAAFKSFALVKEGALSSINLFPLKRFMPPVSAYFAPEDEKKIVDALGNYLPYEERKLDGIDRLSRRLRL